MNVHCRLVADPSSSDFGLSRLTTSGVYMKPVDWKEAKIPYRWAAPEVISKGIYSSKAANALSVLKLTDLQSDCWSYGVLLYEMFTFGGKPYEDIKKNSEVVEFVLSGGRLNSPSNVPSVISSL